MTFLYTDKYLKEGPKGNFTLQKKVRLSQYHKRYMSEELDMYKPNKQRGASVKAERQHTAMSI